MSWTRTLPADPDRRLGEDLARLTVGTCLERGYKLDVDCGRCPTRRLDPAQLAAKGRGGMMLMDVMARLKSCRRCGQRARQLTVIRPRIADDLLVGILRRD